MFSLLSPNSIGISVWGATALALVLGGIGAGAAGCTAPPVTHTVVIDGTAFQPAALTVKAGDSIVWINKDPFPHTVTSASGVFDSKPLQPSQSWTYVAGKKGELSYVCTLHPTMKGTLRVE
jgi:plastocyanin